MVTYFPSWEDKNHVQTHPHGTDSIGLEVQGFIYLTEMWKPDRCFHQILATLLMWFAAAVKPQQILEFGQQN